MDNVLKRLCLIKIGDYHSHPDGYIDAHLKLRTDEDKEGLREHPQMISLILGIRDISKPKRWRTTEKQLILSVPSSNGDRYGGFEIGIVGYYYDLQSKKYCKIKINPSKNLKEIISFDGKTSFLP